MKMMAKTTDPAQGADARHETLSPWRNSMKLGIALLLIGTTLGAGSAAFAAGQGLPHFPDAGLASRPAPDAAVTLIDDDGDEGDDEGEGGWFWSQPGDDDDGDDCDEEDDDDGCAAGSAGDAAKAGTVPPPQNGLFTNGTAPVVKSN